MKIIIKARNLELTDDLRAFITEKIGGLQKFTKVMQREKKLEGGKDLIEFFVEVEKETNHHVKGPYFRAKARVNLPGKGLIAFAKAEDLNKAIVEVKDELQQEIKKYKLKGVEVRRKIMKSKRIT